MNIDTRNQIISIFLGVVIIALAWLLYDSIVTPYQEVIEREEMTERVRERMLDIKDVLVQYDATYGHFPPTEGGLDSVVWFVQNNELMASIADSVFGAEDGTFDPNTIVFSPRNPAAKFRYTLNDTLRPPLYLLEDPDTDDAVGSLTRTTMRNAPTWN